jgi:TolB-like protein/Tfp pilus assembly protein PilF
VPGESAALLKLAESIADGAAIDWQAAEADATAEERAIVRQLRILADVAVLHRSLPASPDDWGRPSESSPHPRTPAIGTWGHLILLERLGSGTTGEVYRAWDRQLEREVALKLLRAGTSAGPQVDRITREGRLLARVRHPNVITVYGVGVHDGRAGLWMELVRGATLEQLLASRGRFSAREAALIGVDLCRALAAIHGAGLIHRDVKAQNVVREEGGRTVLMDLGTGRDTASTSRPGGDLAGTPLYLAPEVLDGAAATVRSDIYSLGVLLYRLVTRAFPVRATTIEELHTAHANGQGLRLRDTRPDLPTAFVGVVDRAMAADAARRHATAGALEADLERALETSAAPRGRVWWRTAALAAMVVAVVGLAALASPWLRSRFGASPAPIRSIAVLPLVNLSGDPRQEYFADGMTDELISTLGRLKGLDVISRTSVMQFKGSTKALPEIARTLKADGIVEGSILILPAMRDGEAGTRRVRISARLIRAGTDGQLWNRTFESAFDDVLRLQADVARAVASGVSATRDRTEALASREMERRNEQDADAFDLYLRGRYYWNLRTAEGLKRSIQYFQESIDRDPRAARAHAGLADSYTLLGIYGLMPQHDANLHAERAAKRALEIDESLGEAHASLALLQMQRLEWTAARASFTRALDLKPGYVSAHHWYSAYLACSGRLPEALAEIDRAIALDPLSISVSAQRAAILLLARRPDEAIAHVEQLIRTRPGFASAHSLLADGYSQKRDYNRALAEIRRAGELGDRSLELQAKAGYIHAVFGRRAAALNVATDLVNRNRKSGEATAGGVAAIYAALNDKERAFEWLQRAVEAREPSVAYVLVDPVWDNLRSDPRFERVLVSVGVPR